MMRGLVLAAVLAATSHLAPGAEVPGAPGTITILEGQAQVYRAAGRLHAGEGMRLAPGDIVETDAKTFAQIELNPQAVLQLGPATRLLVGAPVARKGAAQRTLYVMSGWTKLIGAPREVPGFELRTPLIEIPASAAVVVMHTTPAQTHLFVERGELRLAERQAKGNPIVVSLQSGDRYLRKDGARGVVNAGSLQAFLQDMPRHFRDPLPRRLDRFGGREAPAAAAPDFAYADVEAWLKSEPGLRRGFVQRWRSKAKDASFRAALVSNLASHPEWDPVLFPEKYLPKEPRRAAAASGALAPLPAR